MVYWQTGGISGLSAGFREKANEKKQRDEFPQSDKKYQDNDQYQNKNIDDYIDQGEF